MESPRLMDQARDALRVHHYSLRTEAAPAHLGNCSCVALPPHIPVGRLRQRHLCVPAT